MFMLSWWPDAPLNRESIYDRAGSPGLVMRLISGAYIELLAGDFSAYQMTIGHLEP